MSAFDDDGLPKKPRQFTTKHEHRAAAIAQSEKAFADAVIESLPGVVYFYDEQGRFIRWNDNLVTVSGYSGIEIAQMHPLDFFSGDDRQNVQQRIAEVFERGQSSIEAAFVSKNGHSTPYFFTGRRLLVHGMPCLVGMGIDIADRKEAGDRLAESERKYRELVEHANSIILRWNSDGRITFLNEFGQRFFGYCADDVIGRHVIGTIVPHVETAGRDLTRIIDRIREDPAAYEHNVNENMRSNGERVSIAWTNRIGRDACGEVADILSVGTDITEQKRTEGALRESEERYRAMLDSMLEGCQLIGFDWCYLYLNDAAAIQNRRPNQELLGRAMTDVWPGIEASDVFAMLRRTMVERSFNHSEIEFMFPDGTSGWFDVRSRPVPEGIFVLSIDVTEKRVLEEQLRQAQKLEALGQLAGGVAHDFNNVLTAILGFSDLMMAGMSVEDPGRKDLLQIKKAGERAAGLTRQLLAFSRKQMLRPQVLSVNEVVTGMESMLRRLILEHISLSVSVTGAMDLVRMDATHLEQIVVNLVVNAADAMPRGGKVTIETAKVSLDEQYQPSHLPVTPGEYVMLVVSDTGAGMNKATRQRIFEPFFTTKHVGHGTGLGLATVYGIVKQSGGDIGVWSEEGRGSTFTVLLPHVSAVAPDALEQPAESGDMPRGSETILLVEDDDSVRLLARVTLERCGYRVLQASNPQEAIGLAGQFAGPIHLLVSDVILPQSSDGPPLFDHLAKKRRGLRVLFMSGYGAEVIGRHGVPVEGAPFLTKPFTALGLARKVYDLLETPPLKVRA